MRERGKAGTVLFLVGVGVACIAAGFLAGGGELAVVLGVFLVLLAGGVLNWDRRAGH
jgi:hypothetical protein